MRRCSMELLILAIVVIGIGPRTATAAPSCPSGPTCTDETVAGRSVVQCVPSGLGGSTARPLVIGLHGGGVDPAYFVENTGGCEMNALASSNSFVTVYPRGSSSQGCATYSGPHYFWGDCRNDNDVSATGVDDLGALRNVIDAYIGHSGSDFKIDPNKVYVWGQSNGGMMAYRVGRQLSDRVAAIAAQIANEPQNSSCTSNPVPISPTPVLIMNGDVDEIMPAVGGTVEADSDGDESPPNGCNNGDTRGVVESYADTVDDWLAINGCSTTATSLNHLSNVYNGDGTSDAPYFGNSTVDLYTYSTSCTESASALAYVVLGGGHRSPLLEAPSGITCLGSLGCRNADITAADRIWNFFSGKTLGTTIHVATAMTAGAGTLGGSLSATYNDDTSYVTASNVVSPSVAFTFHIGPRSLTSLNALVRSKDAKSTGTTRKVYFYNVSTATWVLQSSTSVGTAESEVQFQVTAGLTNYRDSSGNVNVAVEHSRSSQTTTMSIDRILFGVNQ